MGSNENGRENLSVCRHLLESVFADIVFSDISITAPYGKVYTNDFTNQLAFAYTTKPIEEVLRQLKVFEQKMGRDARDKQTGVVIIDIDLVIWNDKVLKPEDMQRTYVAELLHRMSI